MFEVCVCIEKTLNFLNESEVYNLNRRHGLQYELIVVQRGIYLSVMLYVSYVLLDCSRIPQRLDNFTHSSTWT